jgi:outer membrane protein OmpA-like peptidoglycan-associated protein
MMRDAHVTAIIAAVLLGVSMGCGGAPAPSPSDDGTVAAAAGHGEDRRGDEASALPRASGVGFEWEDPEPPDAQARAEDVLNADWNKSRTTRLVMNITTLVDRTSGIEGLRSDLEGSGLSLDDRLDGLGAKITDTDVTISLSGSILFDFDSADIRPDAEKTLGEVVEVVVAYSDRPVRVEGHTDSIASDAYNQKLSLERAQSVARWLAQHGVKASRLQHLGHGESRPVADNGTADGRQLNRRVEIIIEK